MLPLVRFHRFDTKQPFLRRCDLVEGAEPIKGEEKNSDAGCMLRLQGEGSIRIMEPLDGVHSMIATCIEWVQSRPIAAAQAASIRRTNGIALPQ